MYLAAVIAGGGLAVVATHYAARDNVYVMFAVLFVVTAAILGGTGPAITVAITAVIGDDVVLRGRLPPLDQWRDELVFATVAIAVGLIVAAKGRQQRRAERLAWRERALRVERDGILAAISHDVKNPLAVIIGSARQGLASGAAADVERLFSRIDSAAVHASDLIDELIDLRRLDGSEIELDLHRCDLRRSLDAAIDQMQALLRGHALHYAVPDAPVVAPFDERRLQRVFQNLIGNAIKYSPDGGDIDVVLRAAGQTARVTIRDRGIGIAADERTRVFERGYRGRSAAGIDGSGLGLFISAEIVKRHGGSITCAPAPDGGTEFEVRLPLVGNGASPEPVEQLAGDRSGLSAADRTRADGHDRDELPRRAGEERLVGAK